MNLHILNFCLDSIALHALWAIDGYVQAPQVSALGKSYSLEVDANFETSSPTSLCGGNHHLKQTQKIWLHVWIYHVWETLSSIKLLSWEGLNNRK